MECLKYPDNVWDRYFAGIAKCCTLLENSNHINLDISRLDPAKRVEYENNLKDIRMWRAEVTLPPCLLQFRIIETLRTDSYHQIDIGYQ